MPIYDYVCASTAGTATEVIHGIDAPGPRFCPAAAPRAPCARRFARPAVHFKGSGWAKKDRSTAIGRVKRDTGSGSARAMAAPPAATRGIDRQGVERQVRERRVGADSATKADSTSSTGSTKDAKLALDVAERRGLTMPPAATDWISLEEAAEILSAANVRFRPATIGGWARAGKVQSIKLGGRRFVRRGEIKALVAAPRRVRASDLQPGLFEDLRD